MDKLIDLKLIYLLIMILPLVGVFLNGIGFRSYSVKGALLSTGSIWLGLVISIFGLVCAVMSDNAVSVWGLRLDGLALTMNTLIFFVSAIVHQFSRRYMLGDSTYRRYFLLLSSITISASIMVCADHLLLFWAAWTSSNCLLVMLMIHKKTWLAAKNSGLLALKFLALGSLSMLVAFSFLYQASGSFSVTYINQHVLMHDSFGVIAAVILITMTALIQSAQWPFNTWLTSSLNSPTPVSALMHAGLVNGGGFLLVKFAPLFLSAPLLLNLIFIIGAITAVLGTFWKLLQTDIKKMLACSTMAQMGFMIMQCGLGLFPAAIAHLCWHGLFKSFLFLNAGSAVNKKYVAKHVITMPLFRFVLACFAGGLGGYCFAIVSEKTIFTLQPTTFLVGFAFISGAQFAYTLLQNGNPITRFVPTCVVVAVMGIFYGESIHLIEACLPILSTSALPDLNILNFLVFGLFLVLWLMMNFNCIDSFKQTKLWAKLYMSALNASQPHHSTITTSRKTYQY